MNIKRVGKPLRPVGLLPALFANTHRFGQLTFREDMEGGPHGNTNTIFLKWPKEHTPEAILERFDSGFYPAYREVHAFRILFLETQELLRKTIERAMIIRLAPGGVIGEHTDMGLYADMTDRYHLPLITNRGAWLISGGQKAHLAKDTLYYFNKHVPHSGANEGKAWRIHLVVDALR